MELNEAIDELRGDIRKFNEEAVDPIKERLASLEERGTTPSDEKVKRRATLSRACSSTTSTPCVTSF